MIAAQLAIAGSPLRCTPLQAQSLREVLLDLVRDGAWELHHADLLGAIEDAHVFWRACRQRVVIHPSTSNAQRALLDHDDRRPPLSPRERDIALAEATQALVHVPGAGVAYGDHPVYRSARRRGRPIFIVLPSGSVQQWTHGLAPMDPSEEETP